MLNERVLNSIVSKSKSARTVVFLDIDETLLNTTTVWRGWINEQLGLNISISQVEEAGSFTNYFKNIGRYDEVKETILRLTHDNEMSRDLPLIQGALDGIGLLSEMNDLKLVCYLTSRPDAILSATKNDLTQKGFPELPIISRSENILRENASVWKYENVAYVNSRIQSNVVLIDDNLELGLEIRKLNHNSKKPIISIVYNGLLTHFAVEKARLTSEPRSHFYIATWDSIPGICQRYL